MKMFIFLIGLMILNVPVIKVNYTGKVYYADIAAPDNLDKIDFVDYTSDKSYFHIIFYEKDKKYNLKHECFLSDDMVMRVSISYGSYCEMNDSLILNDELLGYKMYMNKKGNSVLFTKSFPLLVDKPFIYTPDSYGEYKETMWYDYDLNKVKLENKRKYKLINNFSCGLYHGEYANHFYLKIDPTGDYCYYIEKTPLSRGKWEKKGNEILLKDSSIGAVFSLLITKEGLVSQFLPGSYSRGVILNKIK